MSDPTRLAHTSCDACYQTVQHSGTARGRMEVVVGVQTYVTGADADNAGAKNIVLLFPDVFGPQYINNQLLMDYVAGHGFTVLCIDYFRGDAYTEARITDTSFDRKAWRAKIEADLRETGLCRAWVDAVRARYPHAKISTFGHCFGGRHAIEACVDDAFVATAIAHPGELYEEHFNVLKVPILLSCAEEDRTFPKELRRRAEDALVARKHTYHFQIFSGVSHGFAVRGNPDVENERWAKEECARGMVEWFKRFGQF
ncbi:alpha beta-hydrolase [Coniophora puteana RWD-64-598 SS2]|uniref:Alpha beta-hydrolase n=1 Tax=Coniophora puteana (strain RWD-64-598) TaxID=741705 RepID=A0A5M3MM85_CONPW|nr:alpha beta-hydrolase [Coniophora puteana RWD-64-598 SS2]EIW80156.1 alpha beta-hydrolase [Coniophora puteana RWD-64-598 SS2]